VDPSERRRQVEIRRFGLITAAVSAFFWLPGAISQVELVADGLPLSAGMFVAPAVAVWATRSRAITPPLPTLRWPRWHRALSFAGWTAVMPVVLACSFALTWVLDDDVPSRIGAGPAAVLGLCLVFAVSSGCEEIGYSRFLAPALLARSSVLRVGLGIGTMWAALHVVPYLQAGRPWSWIAWQCAFTLAFRVLIVAVLARPPQSWGVAVAVHASYDVAWVLTPVGGSSYDPRYAASLTALAAALLVLSPAGRRSAT